MASLPNAPTGRVSAKANQDPLAYGPQSIDPGLQSAFDEYFEPAEDERVLDVSYDDLLALDEYIPEDKQDMWSVDTFAEFFVTSTDSCLYGLVQWARSEGGYEDVSVVGELPITHTRIEDLRARDIGTLVSLDVRCTDRTKPFPVVVKAAIRCPECGMTIDRWQSRADGDVEFPVGCSGCDAGKRRLNHEQSRSEFIDTQQAIVQDLHTLASAYDPFDIEADIQGHHVGMVESGDTVTLTAIVRADESDEKKSDLYLQVVGVASMENEIDAFDLSDDDIDHIRELSERDDIFERLSQSFAPDINGDGPYTVARHALMYQWFGGVPYGEYGTESYRRGAIHVALVGDPGTAKSLMAKGSTGPIPISEYVSADNVTKVGLTAAVTHEDRFDGSEWTVKGGALVKADGGHAVVDEVDSASDDMQSGLQEALASQQLSVSKAGVKADLPARCSVTLVANPEGERFDNYRALDKQISLNPTIWSRMDIIVPFLDEPDEDHDSEVALGVLGRASESTVDDGLDKETIAKYISHARTVEPKMPDEVQEFLQEKYVEKRQSGGSGRVPIGPRQLDGMRRLSQASARIRLSDTVSLDDARRAYDLVNAWMSLLIPDQDGDWDINNITGSSVSKLDKEDAFWRTMDALSDENGVADRRAVTELLEAEFEVDEAYQEVNKHLGRDDLIQDEDENGNTLLVDKR